MENPLLPPEERHLTPDQVEALDKRRDLGHTLLVIAGQSARVREGGFGSGPAPAGFQDDNRFVAGNAGCSRE